MDGIEFACACCGVRVSICRACWRGQRYCSLACQIASRRFSQRVRQSRYAKSDKGRFSQQRRSRRWRRHKKFATDASSTPEPPVLNTKSQMTPGCCRFCGCRIYHPVMRQEFGAAISFSPFADKSRAFRARYFPRRDSFQRSAFSYQLDSKAEN